MLKSLSSAAIVLILCCSAQAATIVDYNPVGLPGSGTPPTNAPATTVATGITADPLVRGPGVNPAVLTHGFSGDGWNRDDPSRATALANGDYFQFSFSVDPSYVASLETLDLSLRRSAVNAPMNLELQASLDGFATPGFTISAFNYYGRTSGTAPSPDPLLTDPYYYMTNDLPGRANATTSPGDPIPTIDLTAVTALQDLPEGSSVTFRLYAWGNSSTASTNTLALGRMVGPMVGGTVTLIPEPASAALAVFAGLATMMLRRRD